MTQPRLLALTGDESGCAMWRVWQPYDELKSHGYVADYAPIHGCPKCGMSSRPDDYRLSNLPWQCGNCAHVSQASDSMELLLPLVASGRYNVVVTPRVVWPSAGQGDVWIQAIHRAGLAWVYEVDDDVYSPRIIERQMKLFESEARKGRAQLEWERQERIRFLSLCDGVSVSTERLATIVRTYAPESTPVIVTPNLIDARWFRRTLRGCNRVEPLQGHLTVGWAGGTREDVDVLALAEAWSVIAARYRSVRFVVQGYIPRALVEAVPAEQRVTLPWLPLDEYPRGLLNIDIGCCPLAPNIFNSAKSAIKWYEMTLAGAACVVSPTVYGKAVTHNYDACVAESADDWVFYLSRMIEDAVFRKSIRETARRTVMTSYSLQAQWRRWPEAFGEIAERYAEHQPKLVLARG